MRAERLANFFFNFASNKPSKWGVYEVSHANEINELITHYEEDFIEGI